MVRQFVAEGLVLVLLASVLGVALAFLGLKVLLHFAPDSVPRTDEIGVGLPVLGLQPGRGGGGGGGGGGVLSLAQHIADTFRAI